jgi:hypothetical protein
MGRESLARWRIKLSNDPQFAANLKEIVGMYVNSFVTNGHDTQAKLDFFSSMRDV